MYTKTKHSQLKKTPAGESGLSERVPLHLPGTVNSDPAGAIYMTYAEQLKSPKWQKKRLEIMERDKFMCQICLEDKEQLHVHHIFYLQGKKVWEYPDNYLITLCEDCHKNLHTQTELIFQSIVEHYNSGDMAYDITTYLRSLRVAVKLNDYQIRSFNNTAIDWDNCPF